VAETCTQNVRKVGAEPKSNNESGAGPKGQGGLIMRIFR